MNLTPKTSETSPTSDAPVWLQIVRERVAELRFGTVQIMVHEGRVTQVDSTQRTRLTRHESAAD